MALELRDCTFFGPALPEPFVAFELEAHLVNEKLLRKNTGPEGKALIEAWEPLRRKLRALGDQGDSIRVKNHVLLPLAEILGYAPELEDAGQVVTRLGEEDGGLLFRSRDGKATLRAFALDTDADFDAPNRRGHAYRYSPSQIAERVLLAKGERAGLLTNGTELRLLFSDPARTGGHIAIGLDRALGWRGHQSVPDSFRLLLALASPKGLAKIPELTEQARLTQTRVTTKLREQAKLAIAGFVQELLDDPRNTARFAREPDKRALAQTLWSESLAVIYRLLFILKLESSPDPAQAFSFRSTSLWRSTYSPTAALSRLVLDLHQGLETGTMLGDGLRVLFRLFQDEGLHSSELKVSPLGGMLFGKGATPLLDSLTWSERAAACLLDNLLWTPKSGKIERQRVHYGSLWVEDLGRVYEALLELEPGIAEAPMCRLRRQKLEVVVPQAQGEAYRTSAPAAEAEGEEDDEETEEEGEEDKPARGKTRVLWIEEIPRGRFYLRVGLGRKATGSYYTPHAFVRFLIQETLGPQVAERSPASDPQPEAILKLKVLDPAMGSGHFLVEACRFLGDKLYEACRLCDELASEAEKKAEAEKGEAEKAKLGARAEALRKRVEVLPDPNDELVAYLPSRVREGGESGLSQAKALALSRRLVAVHCLYGVDKNPLAVELAKLSLWLESYAEGLPLTFMDHRLIAGDSLTGPFFDKLKAYPKSGEEVRDLYTHGLTERLEETLRETLKDVEALEASIGKDVADIELKRSAKIRLDKALAPFRVLTSAWTGGVMLGELADDDAYAALMAAVAKKQDAESLIENQPTLARMIEVGREAVSYDLRFLEVFYPSGKIGQRCGFDAVVGNPPWDAIKFNTKEFFAAFDIGILDAPTKRERELIERRVLLDTNVGSLFLVYRDRFEAQKYANDRNYSHQKITIEGDPAGRQLDAFRVFTERCWEATTENGSLGLVVPSAFHVSAGAVGIRRLLLLDGFVRSYFVFINTKRLFEISSGLRFGILVCNKRQEHDYSVHSVNPKSEPIFDVSGFRLCRRRGSYASHVAV